MQIQTHARGHIQFESEVVLNGLQVRMANGHQFTLTIDWGDYQRHGWSQLSHKITRISSEVFFIFNNQCPTILRELSHVSFPHLKKLVATNNSILSLQCLVRYDWPNLKELDLSNNLITSARPLAKTNLLNLQSLNFNLNPLMHREDFFKANFSRLKVLSLSALEQLRQKKIQASADPIIWKIKLQPFLQGDLEKPLRYARHYYGRNRGVNEAHSQRLTYVRYKEQLKQKGKRSAN